MFPQLKVVINKPSINTLSAFNFSFRNMSKFIKVEAAAANLKKNGCIH